MSVKQETNEVQETEQQVIPADQDQSNDSNEEVPVEEPAVEEVTEVEAPEAEVEEKASEDDIPKEVLRSKLAESNKEAANYRTKLRESEALVTELRNERQTSERELVVEVVTLKHKVPENMIATIAKLAEAGVSRDELETHAKAFGELGKSGLSSEPSGGLNPGDEPDDKGGDARARVRAIRKTRI